MTRFGPEPAHSVAMGVPSFDAIRTIDVSDWADNSAWPLGMIMRMAAVTPRKSKILTVLSGRFQNVFDAADGDDDPVWAVVELVADFVNGFVEEVGFKKNLEVVRILRNKGRVGGGLQVFLKEDAAHLSIPNVGPVFEKRDVFASHGWLPKSAVSRVLKRAHHSGDIAQRRALEFTLAQRPRRFAFEIENDEILSGRKDLAEMIVAVDADFRSISLPVEETFFAGENFLFSPEHFLCFAAKMFRHIGQFLL